MFGIVLSALNAVLAFVLRSVIVKFALYFGLFFVTTEFMSVLASSVLPTGDGGMGRAFAGLGIGTWYFLDLMDVSFGVPAVLSAWLTRFVIRRIPIIG